jgi:hypothetical protein
VRADLREEFDMADEAFALSPISARATLPGEEDYAAIAEAFMETSRGRWFLTEYAKRNRNADTRMVLDAVARIEQSLATQREEEREREATLLREEGLSAQQAQQAVTAAAAAQDRLTEALAAIRGSVEAAEESAVEALDSLALEQRLAPVRKGARVLREIAWRLREIGNDGRICDLIDSQVTVIEKSTDQFSSEEARLALRAAFSALQGRLVEFSDDEQPLPAETEAALPAPMMASAAAEEIEAVLAKVAAKAPPVSPPVPPVMRAEAAPTNIETPPPANAATVAETVLQETAAQSTHTHDTHTHDIDTSAADADDQTDALDADAQDEAVLDMIAMEMGAPDPISDDEIAEAAAEQARLAEPAAPAPVVVARAPEPVAMPPMPVSAPMPVQQVIQAPPPPPAPAPAPAVEMSLGSSLIASGMLRKPITAANDPLAPIRRMSQAEKIAFFS